MTTLPQTTPMRLPRSGGQHIAIPGTGPMGPAQPQQQHFIPSTTGMTGSDIWRVIRTNAWLIISMLVIFGIAGYLLNTYLAARWPHYQAMGLVKVQGNTTPDLHSPNGGGAAYDDPTSLAIEISSQVKEMLHPTLLGQVLTDNDDLRRTSWFQKFVRRNPDGSPMPGQDGKPLVDTEAAKEDLADRLAVAPYPNSRLITVSATCADPNDCRTLIEAVVNQHINVSRLAQEAASDKNQQYFHNLQSQLTSELGELAGKIQHLSMELGNMGEDIGNNSSRVTFELQTLLAESLKADQAATQTQAKLDLFNQQLDSGITPPEVQARYESNPAYWDYRRMVDQAELDLGMDRNSPDAASPLRQKSGQQRLDGLKRILDDLTAELKDNEIARVKTELTSELKSDHDTQAEYKKKVGELQTQIAQISTMRNELEELRAESRDKRANLALIQDKLDQMTLIQEMAGWGTVDWAEGGLPDVPTKPVFPKLSVTLPASLALGLALALGIAFLREMTDTSVRSPRDIARVGQLTVLGMIPHSDDDLQSQAARLPLVIYDAPHSMVAEQFRQVRTRLHHAASLDTTRSILITGCGPGDGKTTVAANIAAGLALNGRRILLVDANFRRPDLHNIFNLSNELGFGDVLGSVSLFEQAIRETEVPNLSVIVNGTRPSNPTELLESQLFIDFIERALEEFDHVIFDSGPLLIVSETIAMAPRVDGVVTVIRARTNSRGMLSRMRDQLRQLKAEHLGVILNAVRSHGGGYYGPMIKAYYAYQNGENN
jgi:succinoglycan biosynthesis transport protein ExoP